MGISIRTFTKWRNVAQILSRKAIHNQQGQGEFDGKFVPAFNVKQIKLNNDNLRFIDKYVQELKFGVLRMCVFNIHKPTLSYPLSK